MGGLRRPLRLLQVSESLMGEWACVSGCGTWGSPWAGEGGMVPSALWTPELRFFPASASALPAGSGGAALEAKGECRNGGRLGEEDYMRVASDWLGEEAGRSHKE
jgi:hypothetical protein